MTCSAYLCNGEMSGSSRIDFLTPLKVNFTVHQEESCVRIKNGAITFLSLIQQEKWEVTTSLEIKQAIISIKDTRNLLYLDFTVNILPLAAFNVMH